MVKHGGAKNLFLAPGAIYPFYPLFLTVCFDKDMINLINEKNELFTRHKIAQASICILHL